MPTYEYVCPKCGHEFEQFQQMSAEPIKRCPKCKKLGVKRLVGKGAGLIFKGTGFYITDYKKTAAPKEGGEGGSGGGETKSGGGENKPAGGEGKSGEGKSGEGRSGEGKSGEGKSGGNDKSGGESKSSDSSTSSSDSKSSSGAKPAAKEKPKSGHKT